MGDASAVMLAEQMVDVKAAGKGERKGCEMVVLSAVQWADSKVVKLADKRVEKTVALWADE